MFGREDYEQSLVQEQAGYTAGGVRTRLPILSRSYPERVWGRPRHHFRRSAQTPLRTRNEISCAKMRRNFAQHPGGFRRSE
jgi:hypothetical protein